MNFVNQHGRIAAIETAYKGYRFRSRLEARWAVFFDALGIKWEYEPEGFDLPQAGRYLPDFYLPGPDVFFEVKGVEPDEDETLKAYVLARETGKQVVIVCGMPDYDKALWRDDGLFVAKYPAKVYFGHHRPSNAYGGMAKYIYDSVTGRLECGMRQHFAVNNIPWPGFDGTDESLREIAALDAAYYTAKYGQPHPRWAPYRGFVYEDCENLGRVLGLNLKLHREVIGAINAMRSARFEHGETGGVA